MPVLLPVAPVRRRHLFEFQDLGWFPSLFRDTITNWLRDALVVGERVYEPVAPLVARLLEHADANRIVDLCSGGSGPWEYLKDDVDSVRGAGGHDPVALTLTDRYPNLDAFRAAADRLGPDVDFRATPVDARDVPADLPGVRTLFSAFHHLDTEDARAVLADAARAGRPVGVFEFTRRDWSIMRGLTWQVPLSMLRMIRTWRPRNRAQLLFTYAVPLIVVTSTWDAIVSNLRTYLPTDLAAMTEGLGGERYRWETGEVYARGAATPITYVLGYPTG